MRIAVFGATGMAGGAIVTGAITREHDVVAVSRHPDPSMAGDRLVNRALDVTHTEALAAILEPGPRSGRYRRGTTTLLVDEDGDSRITARDLAVAVIDELDNPCGERHLTVVRDGAA